jgi:predicted ABC-type ATPase
MSAPRMVIVAGPSGGGKSSIFPIFQMQIDAFSTDLRAATLLGEAMGAGKPVFQPASADVPLYMQFRQQAGQEMERFINEQIDRRKSFAFETTLREVTFDQARRAHLNGFRVEMIFIAGGDEREHIERVGERGVRGGHVASEAALRDIYRRGMVMLRRAFEENQRKNIEILAVFHNPRVPVGDQPRPQLLVEMVRGYPSPERGIATLLPQWFEDAVRGTDFAVERLRGRLDNELER